MIALLSSAFAAAELASSSAPIHAEEVSGVRLLLPAPEDIFWSAVLIVIIAITFYKLILPKMNAALDERSERIEGAMAKAARAQAAANQAHQQGEAILAQARDEAARTRQAAREEGKAIVADLCAQAGSEAERINQAASRQIEAERQAAEVLLRSQVADLATELAGRIVGEQLKDLAVRDRVVDRFLDDLEQSSLQGVK